MSPPHKASNKTEKADAPMPRAADERLDVLACKAIVDFLRRAERDELTASPEGIRERAQGSYIILLSHGFPGLPWFPPLNPSNLSEYREKAWGLFIREHGEKLENHPAMKSITPEKLQGQPVSPGKRRDMIRDAWEGAWKTIARQFASQK